MTSVPGGPPRGSRPISRPSARRISVPVSSSRATREQRHLGDRGDAGQRLAAKAERAEMAQVIGGRQLARGVALEGQGRLGRRDAAAVVLDADQPPAALAHLHADVGRARVQAVLDQLLDRRRGPLDHLAGGDLVGNFGRKDVDGHGGIVPQAGRTQNQLTAGI